MDIKPSPKVVVDDNSAGASRGVKASILLFVLLILLGVGLVAFVNHKDHQQSANLDAAQKRWQQSQAKGQLSVPSDLDVNSLSTLVATVKNSMQVDGDVTINGTLTVNGQPVPGTVGVSNGAGGNPTVIKQTVVQAGSGTTTALPSNVTLQGNSFNGAGQLVQLDGSGKLPAIDGSQLTGITATTLNGQPGSFYQNASNLTAGTLSNARLNSDVALLDRNSQIFTGNNQVFQNTANSTTAFEIQNAAGTSDLLVADTTNTRIAIGQATAAYTLDVAGDINVSGGSYRVGGTIGASGVCSGGQFLQNQVVEGGIVTGGTCASGGSSTDLQGAYNTGNSITTTDGRSISFNLANTTTPASFVINMLTGTSGKFQLQANGTPIVNIGPTGAASFQNSVDSTAAFEIDNAGGGAPLFKVDTLNSGVGIGTSPVAGGGMLQIGGALTISQFNSTTFTTPLGSGVNTQLNIPVSSQGAFSQLIALGIDSGSADTARVLSVFDARTGPHQPSIGVLSPDQQNIAGISWEGSDGTVYFKTTGGGIGLRSGSTDLLTVNANGQLGLSNNARGFNVAIGSGANTVAVTFANAYPDANYAVFCTPSYNTTCFVTGKTANGFTINLGSPAPDANQTLDWFVTR